MYSSKTSSSYGSTSHVGRHGAPSPARSSYHTTYQQSYSKFESGSTKSTKYTATDHVVPSRPLPQPGSHNSRLSSPAPRPLPTLTSSSRGTSVPRSTTYKSSSSIGSSKTFGTGPLPRIDTNDHSDYPRRASSISRSSRDSPGVNGSSSNNKSKYQEAGTSAGSTKYNPSGYEDKPHERSQRPHVPGTSKQLSKETLAEPKPRNTTTAPYLNDRIAFDYPPPSAVYEDSANNNKLSGCCGLSNLGNTCYMNAALQCLANTRPLRDYFKSKSFHADVSSTRSDLAVSLKDLISDMWNPTHTRLAPTVLKSQFGRYARRFQGYGQHDSQEFLILLLEEVHEEINRKERKKKEYLKDDYLDKLPLEQKADILWNWYKQYDDSVIVDLLVGQLRSALKCTVCGYVSDCFDPFWGLPLPLKKASSLKLTECFRMFNETEVLDRDEKPTCSKCKQRQKCTKTFTLWRCPRYLMLHLKRFEFHSYGRQKITTNVEYPLDGLDLSPYMDDRAPRCRSIYNLYAVVCHDGSASSGHYYAYCRHPDMSKKWYQYNDSHVSPMDPSHVVTSAAYILFYQLSDHAASSNL